MESGGVTEAAGTEPEEETPILMDVVDPSELSEEVEQAVAVFLGRTGGVCRRGASC